jgi:hypothetical protein
MIAPPTALCNALGPLAQSEGHDGYDGENGAGGGIAVVKNKDEWLESRKKLKERKKRAAKDDPTGDEPAVFGFPMGGFKEQIERLLDAARRRRGDS